MRQSETNNRVLEPVSSDAQLLPVSFIWLSNTNYDCESGQQQLVDIALQSEAEFILHTGNICKDHQSLEKFLHHIRFNRMHKPFYYVLSADDYGNASIQEAREKISKNVCFERECRWLNNVDYIALNNRSALV